MLDVSKIEKYSNKPFEFGPLQTKWLEALESGNYKQGKGSLRRDSENGPSAFCCLGVLCQAAEIPYATEAEVAAKKAPYWGNMGYTIPGKQDTCNGYLPISGVNYFGMRGSSGPFARAIVIDGISWVSLADMNDFDHSGGNAQLDSPSAFSFADIAALIRHDPHNVFTKAA